MCLTKFPSKRAQNVTSVRGLNDPPPQCEYVFSLLKQYPKQTHNSSSTPTAVATNTGQQNAVQCSSISEEKETGCCAGALAPIPKLWVEIRNFEMEILHDLVKNNAKKCWNLISQLLQHLINNSDGFLRKRWLRKVNKNTISFEFNIKTWFALMASRRYLTR
jgi:hypothetical protein